MTNGELSERCGESRSEIFSVNGVERFLGKTPLVTVLTDVAMVVVFFQRENECERLRV